MTDGTRYDATLSHFESDEVPASELFEEMVRRQKQTIEETGAVVYGAASRPVDE